MTETVQTIRWEHDRLVLLDQRVLPEREEYLSVDSIANTAEAIKQMVVRGAPAIGVTAAYGVVLGATAHYALDAENWRANMAADLEHLCQARPTAINLRWAVERMHKRFADITGHPQDILLAEAQTIHAEDIVANRRMGVIGSAYLKENCSVLTHCNAGALATGGYGTALGVIRAGHAAGKITQVYADETRPWFQGARLTAWELIKDGIPVTLIPDSAAAHLMRLGSFQWVIVGADRIAANGDVANKIGTYSLAVNARQHGLKFMVVAPTSTIDMGSPDGDAIPIEDRDGAEVLYAAGRSIAPQGATARNPVFDITPAALIDVIVTEKGAVETPENTGMHPLFT